MDVGERLKVRTVWEKYCKGCQGSISSGWFNSSTRGCVGTTLKMKLPLKCFHFHIQTDLCGFIDWLQTAH